MMSITWAIRAPRCAVLSSHSPKTSPGLGQHYHITCIPASELTLKSSARRGSSPPWGHWCTPAGPGPLPHQGQQRAELGPLTARREHQYRASSDWSPLCDGDCSDSSTFPSPSPSPQHPNHRALQHEHSWKGCFYSRPWSSTGLPQPSKAHACLHTDYF